MLWTLSTIAFTTHIEIMEGIEFEKHNIKWA